MALPQAGQAPIYSGTLDCMKKTLKNEGLKGFYKGMGAPLAGVAPIFAISFMGYRVGKEILGPPPEKAFGYLDYFKAGAFSGIFTTVIMAPGERIKCLLQIQGDSKTKKYNGPIDCAKQLYKEGGIKSIYRGSGATLLRGTYIYFIQYKRTVHLLCYVTNYISLLCSMFFWFDAYCISGAILLILLSFFEGFTFSTCFLYLGLKSGHLKPFRIE